MPTDNLTAIGELILDTTTAAQEAILAVAGTIGESLKPVTETLQSLPFADLYPKADEAVGAAFGFAEKLLANQHDFATKLVKSYSL